MKNTKNSASLNLNDPKALEDALTAHYRTTLPEAYLYAFTKCLEKHCEIAALQQSVKMKGHKHRTVTVTLPDALLERFNRLMPRVAGVHQTRSVHFELLLSVAINKGLAALELES